MGLCLGNLPTPVASAIAVACAVIREDFPLPSRFMNLQDLADDWDQLLFGMASKPANFTCGRCMQPQKWMYNRNAMLLPNQVIEVKARVLQKEVCAMHPLPCETGWLPGGCQPCPSSPLLRSSLPSRS